ncbi:MAG: Rieske (2Fe-2S) protein [Gammaproteobacteria bacterium]|nr:Rieske (2Fe-2S) protein [Gammaproteobacteria bacterium]
MTTRDQGTFILACDVSEIPDDGKILSKIVRGKSILLARHSEGDDRVVAFESTCPHYQGPLRFGHVVDGEVVCPWHFMRFDTITGETVACDKTIMQLKTYSVQVVDGQIYIDMPSD